MNASETVTLTEFVQKLCPSQPFDRDTWKTWLVVLADIPYSDAQKATLDVYKTLGDDRAWGARRIEPDDILRAVNRIRNVRVAAGPAYVPSKPDLTPREQLAEQREHLRSIALGEAAPYDGRRRLGTRTIRQALTAGLKNASDL